MSHGHRRPTVKFFLTIHASLVSRNKYSHRIPPPHQRTECGLGGGGGQDAILFLVFWWRSTASSVFTSLDGRDYNNMNSYGGFVGASYNEVTFIVDK